MMRLGVIDANDMLIEAELDNRIFHVGLSWNETGQLWSLSIRDLNLSVLASGISVVANWPLFVQMRRPEFPEGELAVYAVPGSRLDRRSFVDGRAGLFYLSAEELA